MTAFECDVARETRDWVAAMTHQWERAHGRRGRLGWALSVLAWLMAGYVSLSAVSLTGMWLYATAKSVRPPLTAAETGAIVLAEMAVAAVLVYLTTPGARRRAARQRARGRVRRLIRAGRLPSVCASRIRLDDAGWTETDRATGARTMSIAWANVRYIDRTDDHLFVGTAGNDVTVVPARSMADAAAFREFADEARTRASAAVPA